MKNGPISHKILLSLLPALILGLLCLPQAGFGQTEKFGIVSYTPPKGWTKTPKENVVAFSEQNQSTGGFCIITVYGATAAGDNPKSDFTREWNNLAVKTLQAPANPQTETQTADGWTIISGVSTVESQGGKAAVFLSVFSGFGKSVSVLAVFNNQSYMIPLEAFIGSINLDKTGAPPTRPATGQNSPPGKFGTLSYVAPAGWSEQQFADGVVFKPLDLPKGEHLSIQIMMPLNASGTLEQALQQSFDETAVMYKATKMNYAGSGNYKKSAVQRSFHGWEYIRGNGGIKVQDGTEFGTEYGLELFVIKVNNRFERVAIFQSRPRCPPLYTTYYTTDRQSYQTGIENLLFSFEFSDFNETGLKPGSTKGSGIVGIWQGVIQGTGLAGATGVSIEAESVIFLTNGQVYFGTKFPLEGFDGLDTRIPPERNPRDWATYTYSNGRGVLKMPYAEIPFRIKGGKLILTKNQRDWSFAKLSPVDGATFNGTYTMSPVGGVTPVITFTSDGRFTDNGALKVLYHEYTDCANPAFAPGSGTYQVKDYTVTFNYTDGRKIKLAFTGIGYDKNDPSPATLMLSYNDDKLTRR